MSEALVETRREGAVCVLQLRREEKLNALSHLVSTKASLIAAAP